MSGGLDIVERGMLDKLLGEIKLGQTGLIDPDTAKKVGKIAGVDAIVTGTITDLQNYVALNCRLIDAQTGRIFSAAQTKIFKDDDLKKIMGAPLSAQGGSSQEKGTKETGGNQGGQQQEIEGFLFDLKKCTLSGNTVSCDLLITNKGDDRNLNLWTGVSSAPWGSSTWSRIVGDDGTEFHATEVSLATSKGSSASSILVSGVPMKARVVYGVSPEIRKAALLEIALAPDFTIQFRNVALTRH